jgi:hypothetical protein
MAQTFRIPATDRKRIADNLHAFVMNALPGKELRVEVCKYVKRRTGEQNALAFAWYAEVAAKVGQESARDVRRYCKLHHGVPIMRAEDAEFREAYDVVIKPLAYELKLIAMDSWPVTSLMETVQLSQYLEAVQQDYMRQGVMLEFPDSQHRLAA